MEIILAIVAAILFALGTVLQQKAGLDEPIEVGARGCCCRWRAGRCGWPASPPMRSGS